MEEINPEREEEGFTGGLEDEEEPYQADEEAITKQITLVSIESEVRYALERGISFKEIGKTIVRGLAPKDSPKGLKQGINRFLLVAELSK